MGADFDHHLRELFDGALELPPVERLGFLQAHCHGHSALFNEVRRLLEAHEKSASFLETHPKQVRRIGRYVVLSELGRGSMGVVYDTIDPMIGRNVAVKVLEIEAAKDYNDAEFLNERLLREARSAGQLSHPNIVTIFDVGQEGSLAFIAMERVDGPSLQKIVSSGHTLVLDEVLRLLRQTASALDYAHQHGIVHRDVKPANIMLQADGTVKVADFGVAKVMSARSTVTGLIMGTPCYMSPEQIQGGTVDGRSDQFSLAVLAYELFAGVRPFRADTIAALAYLIVYSQRRSVRITSPELPPAIDPVFDRALARLPDERFESCEHFVRALETALLSMPCTGRLASPAGQATPIQRQHRKLQNWAVVVCIGAVVFFCLWAVAVYLKPQLKRNAHASTKTPAQVDKTPTAGSPTPMTQTNVTAISTDANAKQPRLDSAGVQLDNETASTRKHKQVSPAERAKELYEEGINARKGGHPEDAVPLFWRSAELGDTHAMLELGDSYQTGEGVEKSDEQALIWFRRAAQSGDVSGMLEAGAMCLLGNGTDEEAAGWFQKATDKGSAAAMYDLASLYDTGRGVAKDAAMAKQLYEKAAALGNTEAQKHLALLPSSK